MTVAELKNLLNRFDDNEEIGVAYHHHDDCGSVQIFEPELQQLWIGGGEITKSEEKAVSASDDGTAKRMIVINF